MREIWLAMFRALLLGAIVLGVGCATAYAQDSALEDLGPLWKLLQVMGPTGVVAYLAIIVGHHKGFPVSITVRFSEESLRVLEQVARTTVIQRYYGQSSEKKTAPRPRGGFHGD